MMSAPPSFLATMPFFGSLDRRIPGWVLANKAQGPNKNALQQESSAIKTAMFLKHGAEEVSGLEAYLDGTFGFEITDEDLLNLFGVLHVLFDEMTNMQMVFRRANKGATLEVTEAGELDTAVDESLKSLMLLYDQRRHHFSRTFSPIGFFFAFQGRQEFPSVELRADLWSTIDFLYNDDRNYVHEVGNVARIKGPSFLPYQVDLESFHFIEPFEKQVENVIGMTLRQFRLCFVALKNYICDRWSLESAQFTYLNRGLVFADPSFLIESLTACLEELCIIENEERKAKEIIPIFLDLLSSHEGVQGYDPLSRRGVGTLHRGREVYTLDLNLIVGVIENFFMDLQLDNEMRRIKGSTFESTVADRIISDCPEISMPIAPGRRLRKRGEGNPFAEVDAYVQLGGLLFLVDCKAYSLTHEYFRGDAKAVTNRRILTEQWLVASDKRAKEIAKNREGANYSIPFDVTHLIPVVCSAFPEFWWTFDEADFLLPRRVPRVCTYHELVELLNSESTHALTEKPFAVPIGE